MCSIINELYARKYSCNLNYTHKFLHYHMGPNNVFIIFSGFLNYIHEEMNCFQVRSSCSAISMSYCNKPALYKCKVSFQQTRFNDQTYFTKNGRLYNEGIN